MQDIKQDTAPFRVMSALAIVSTVNDTVLPALQREGTEVEIIWDPTVALMERIRCGESADAIVAIDWAIDELSRNGRIREETRRPVARAAFGIAMVKGAQKPDMTDANVLRQMLLDCRSIAYSRAGASGIYFEKLIERLEIADEVRAKSIVIPSGFTGELVVQGKAEYAIQQISELMSVEGIELVGPMPPDVQETTDFIAAVFGGAEVDEARAMRFIHRLTDDAARQSYLRHGLTPL